MKKRIILAVFALFLATSCANTQRDIMNPDISKNFKQKDISSPFYGNQNSKVQIIQFGDFQCPACIRFESMIGEKLLKDYALTNKIGITYKNFPLQMHKNAPEDALAGLCAHEQGKYKEFAKNMYKLEEDKKGLVVTKEDRQGVAKASSLDMAKFNMCVEDGRYVNKIKQDMALGEKMGLQGTPSVYVNGNLINYDSVESFFKIIDSLLK